MTSEDSQKSGVKRKQERRQRRQERRQESEERRQEEEEVHRKKEGEEMNEALNVVIEVEVAMPEEQERLQRKKQMVNRAEQLIASISRRRAELEALVEGEAGKSNNWETLHSDSDPSDGLPCSPSVNSLRTAAEPMLQQFTDDLVDIRSKVTLVLSDLSELDMDDDDAEEGVTLGMQFTKIIKVTESLHVWASSILDSWIQYHTTRNNMKAGVDWQRMMDSQDPDFGQHDDMCQAIALWDIKQAEELKCFLNSVLYHYIVLEDTVWEASSSVTGGRRTASSLASMYC